MRLARTTSRSRALAAAAALLLLGAAAAVGCGLGPGEAEEGTASLTVTRDFGAERLIEAETTDPTPSETVVRFLDREAEIETAYGGNFITSIEGVENVTDGRSQEDWFFYVNGYWSPVGAGEAKVRPGDRIWWDYRDWAGAYRVSAVVGSYPEPFVHGFDGERFPTVLDCRGGEPTCDEVADRLDEAGAEVVGAGPDPKDALRVLVGPWEELEGDPAADLLERGPDRSGVYARPERCGSEWRLARMDPSRRVVDSVEGFGLIAATQRGSEQPTWLITGADEAAVGAAADQLDADALRDHFALALDADGAEVEVPRSPGETGATEATEAAASADADADAGAGGGVCG